MIRFIFYSLVVYFIIKLIRIFVEPMFSSSPKTNVYPDQESPKQQSKPKVGEYIDFEEIK